MSSTTASTSPRVVTAMNRAIRRGLRSRFSEVAISARSTLAARTCGRPFSRRRAITPRRGRTARTGPSAITATKSPVTGGAFRRPASGALQARAPVSTTTRPAVGREHACGDERRVVDVLLQLSAPAEARKRMF